MSYFVNGRRVRLIESNLGRRSCFFVISHGASYTHPPLLSAFYPLRLERVTLPSLQLLDCLSFFFLFLFYDGSKKEEEKGVGRSMSIFFYFFDSPFDEWRIRLFGIGWGVV